MDILECMVMLCVLVQIGFLVRQHFQWIDEDMQAFLIARANGDNNVC